MRVTLMGGHPGGGANGGLPSAWPPAAIQVPARTGNRRISDVVLEHIAQPQFWAKPSEHKSMIDPMCDLPPFVRGFCALEQRACHLAVTSRV